MPENQVTINRNGITFNGVTLRSGSINGIDMSNSRMVSSCADECVSVQNNNDSSRYTFDIAFRDYMINTVGNFATTTSSSKQLHYIKQHNYIPEFKFHKLSNKDKLFIGAEIEIDCGGKSDDVAKEVIDSIGKDNVYCKHDGSLSNGFEIVTHPATLEYHKTLPYESTFKMLTDKGYKSHNTTTCGLHIHVDRNYLGIDKLTQDLSISKLLYLFEKFWDKIVLVARRDSNYYASRFYLGENETPLDMYAKSKNASKYGAINLCHQNTVEIRIYKGTLNYNTFINTLEFTKVMVNLARDTDIYNIQNITWDNILKVCSTGLRDYINDREIKEEEKKKEKQKKAVQDYSYTYLSSAGSVTGEGLSQISNRLSNIDWSTEFTPIWTDTNNFTVTSI